jgi:hypothetical protein
MYILYIFLDIFPLILLEKNKKNNLMIVGVSLILIREQKSFIYKIKKVVWL